MGTYNYSTICRHVESETESIQCEIKGTIPSWLNGFVLFNGPGLTKVGSNEYNHAFDSSALLQKIVIKNGSVSYKTKFLRSNTFNKNEKANAITVGEFGTPGPSNKGVLSRLMSAVDSDKMMSDNALLAITKMGQKFYALGESPFFIEIDPSTLDVINRTNMNKSYSLATQSVHILEDQEGCYYTVGQAISVTGPKYSILKFPKDGDIQKGKSVMTVAPRWKLNPCYIHAMAFTEKYAVIVETPLGVSIMELLSDVITNTPFIEGLHWHNEKTKFHVIDRETWKPVSSQYVSDPFFFLHFSTAYEKDDHLIMDICAYKDSSILNRMFIQKLRAASKDDSVEFFESFCSSLKRYIIPLNVKSSEDKELITIPNSKCSAKKVKNEIHLDPDVLTDLPFENPDINKKFSSKGNQFVWGMGASPNRENMGEVIKLDTGTKETLIFKEENFYPSPVIFVPNPNGVNEDDGVILALMLDASKENLMTFIILDASTLNELGRAVVEIKVSVPMPLHGSFFEATQ